ncbi:MAG: restriction endonuclease subunit S [Pseudomonadota bacterium]|nr:restriction endonuclease subunit S [Pseudomonadota bacterium]
MPKVSDLFDVRYGHSLELNRLTRSTSADSVAFVSRTTRNNGVVAYVEPIPNIEHAPAGELTCAMSGNGILSTFLQERRFYTAFHVARLTPRQELSKPQMLYYSMCIKANAYRYSYGRQANRTLRDIVVPDISAIPEYVENIDLDLFEGAKKPKSPGRAPPLDTTNWKPFLLQHLFDIRKGKRLTKADMRPGDTPFISAIDSNNGLRQRVSAKPMHPANVITVNYNGNGVADAFYQIEPFFASDDVNVLYPKFKLDSAVALFFCAVIRREKYRFNYGRKWNLERMNESQIRLPADADGTPDLQWMRRYILSQNFSSQLYEDEKDAEIAKQRLDEIKTNPRTLIRGRELEARMSRLDSTRTKPQ